MSSSPELPPPDMVFTWVFGTICSEILMLCWAWLRRTEGVKDAVKKMDAEDLFPLGDVKDQTSSNSNTSTTMTSTVSPQGSFAPQPRLNHQ